MVIDEVLPTEEELSQRMLYVIKHSMGVEYYLERIAPGYFDIDIERPHDLLGLGNKLEWDVLKGLAVQARKGIDSDKYVLPSVKAHRKQHHHHMWNGDEPSPDATGYDLIVGIIDTLEAMREPRPYNGGSHSWGGIIKKVKDELPKKAEDIFAILPKMIEIEPPNLKAIKSIHDIPNIGLDPHIYEAVIRRKDDAIEMLRNEHGYFLDSEK